jgi:hypothetical protein
MVPSSLRTWFIVQFAADIAFALPLFLAPQWTLTLLGWRAVDPIATRLVAAALSGIGIQSLLGRGEDAATFRAFLNLKIIWSATATIGIVWSQLEGGPPPRLGVRSSLRRVQCALGAVPIRHGDEDRRSATRSAIVRRAPVRRPTGTVMGRSAREPAHPFAATAPAVLQVPFAATPAPPARREGIRAATAPRARAEAGPSW